MHGGVNMSRNFGIPNVTRPPASGGQLLTASHYGAGGTRADSNSLARHPPPGLAEPNLAVVRDSSFFHQQELNPVQRLDAELNDREFAACVFWAVFITVCFGAPIAAATAFMSWG
jgi:hypothetical protein